MAEKPEETETPAAAPGPEDEETSREFASTEEESLNLFMLLHEQKRAMETGTKEELEAAAARVRAKVDAIHHRITKLDAETVRLDKLLKEFAVAKRATQNKRERLIDWARYCMIHFGEGLLHGEAFSLEVKEVDGGVVIDPTYEEPTSRMAMLWPDLIQRSYSWKKTDLLKFLKAGKEGLPPFIRLGKVQKFTPKLRRKA